MQEYYFSEILSTQDYAKELYLEGQKDFLVFSDTQSLGRGRNGRKWSAPYGGMWFSFDLEYNECSFFTLAIGVTIREILEDIYGSKVKLKWPNDLILDGKKVGGIRCEKVKDRVIVGVGINTNIEAIAETCAITFLEKTNMIINNKEVIDTIVKRCKEAFQEKTENIIENFRDNMAYRGEVCFVSAINKAAKIIDISNTGALIVECDEKIQEVFMGEINICI